MSLGSKTAAARFYVVCIERRAHFAEPREPLATPADARAHAPSNGAAYLRHAFALLEHLGRCGDCIVHTFERAVHLARVRNPLAKNILGEFAPFLRLRRHVAAPSAESAVSFASRAGAVHAHGDHLRTDTVRPRAERLFM